MMDFHALMSIASTKQERKDKEKVQRYSLDLAPAKKEEKTAVNSDAVQKLKREKEREKEKERLKAEKAARKEIENQAPKEKKTNHFRIPKKTTEAATDRESFINSLFDDSTLSDGQEANESNHDTSSHANSSSSRASSSSHSNSHSSSSSKSKDRSSGSGHSHKSSHSSKSSNHHESKSHSKGEGSSRKEDKDSSKDSKHHSKSSSKSHSSSHSKHQSSSSSSKSNSSVPSSSSSSKSSKPTDKSSSSNHSSQSASSKAHSSSNSTVERKPSDERPIALSKHHLNPVAERHATNPYLSEKEKILARLKAIKERTLAAIHKESTSKGKRVRSEKGSRKTKEEDKEDERVKSKAIVREEVSSSDDEVPDALDIMLSERNAKLEKEKIARMAKQAWERATKKDKGESAEEAKPERKKRKHSEKSRVKPVKSHRQEHQSHKTKGRAHSLSPTPGDEQKRLPVKPKIVRHAGNAVPPPMDFQALLAMAEKKQHEPQKQDPTIPKKKKKEKEERPMTQEEKERHERIKTKEYQNWLKYGGKQPKDKKNEELEDDDLSDASSKQQSQSKNKTSGVKKQVPAGGDKPSAYAKYVEKQNSKVSVPSRTSIGNIPKTDRNITINENVLVCGSTEDSEGDSPSPQAKVAAANPFDRLFNQVHKKKPKIPSEAKKRRIEDSEYEEDGCSDMDDFIDDGNDGEPDYSKEIKNIFGYDKSRYRYEDDDASDMEADFSTIMKEEKRSAKIGLMEDLEDMRREEEELRRKALLKKKMKK